MLRFGEIGLFVLPFALLALWRLVAPHVRPAVLWAGTGALLLLGGSVIFYGLHERLGPHERYIPAHIEDGRIIEGTGVPR